MSEIVLESKSGALPLDWFSAICAIHDDVFLQPPFAWTSDTSRDNAEDLRQLAEDSTFGVVVARHGSELAGYAYGHRLPTDHGWWRAIPQPLPSEITDEWDGRTFTLTSLAVLPDQRGRGIGKQLINHLLGTRTEERAVLSVQPTALETQSIYRHLGWRQVGRNGPLPGVTPPRWDVYVLECLPRLNPDS
ncbi:GNAT family N-acetyltransferase [Microbispora rosea]|uniref:GNAT family N-acetyltransferase n=1 Tax=Microbispora rosea TaxID=58117 RepID=UPI00068C0700|nr:GNAT family N-acetyltransferase [Microbispora rosea]